MYTTYLDGSGVELDLGLGMGSGLSDGDVGLEVVSGVSSEMENKFVFYLGVCLFRGVSI